MGTYPVSLVGETFTNPDGTSRQDELARCRVGEPVTLHGTDEDDEHHPAVAVKSARGIIIGYAPAEVAGWLIETVDRPKTRACIIQLHGGTGKKSRGVIIGVGTAGGDPASLIGSAVTQPAPARRAASGNRKAAGTLAKVIKSLLKF